MIVGVGLDLVELDRIEAIYKRFGTRFTKKILTPKELTGHSTLPVVHLASRFAAKEAGVKALGTGFALGITLQHLEIVNNSSGRPQLLFSGPARSRAMQMGVHRTHLSISHGQRNAVAVVILESLKLFPNNSGGGQ